MLLLNPSEKEDGERHAHYVVASVELNIALNPDDDPVLPCPCKYSRDTCMHACGVDAITVLMFELLIEFAILYEAEIEEAIFNEV